MTTRVGHNWEPRTKTGEIPLIDSFAREALCSIIFPRSHREIRTSPCRILLNLLSIHLAVPNSSQAGTLSGPSKRKKTQNEGEYPLQTMATPRLNSNGIPAFDDLPLRKGDPPHSAWGLYGMSDELGTLNRLTDERVKEAAAEISTGERYVLFSSCHCLALKNTLQHTVLTAAPSNLASQDWPIGL